MENDVIPFKEKGKGWHWANAVLHEDYYVYMVFNFFIKLCGLCPASGQQQENHSEVYVTLIPLQWHTVYCMGPPTSGSGGGSWNSLAHFLLKSVTSENRHPSRLLQPKFKRNRIIREKVCFVFISENVTQEARECVPPSVMFEHFEIKRPKLMKYLSAGSVQSIKRKRSNMCHDRCSCHSFYIIPILSCDMPCQQRLKYMEYMSKINVENTFCLCGLTQSVYNLKSTASNRSKVRSSNAMKQKNHEQF